MIRTPKLIFWLSLALLVTVARPALAEVRLPSVFSDYMVLQRDIAVPVWGWADPGETVVVSFREQSKSTTVNDDGKWMVRLDSLSVGEPATLSVTGEKGSVTFDDVLIGDVWICSGQSNMAWPVRASLDSDLEAASANLPRIRLFQVPLATATEPQQDVSAEWRICSSESLPDFSGVGYYFGRSLQHVLQVPVGLMHTSVGGTPAEPWTAYQHLAEVEEFQPLLELWKQKAVEYDEAADRLAQEKSLAQWKERVAKARANGRPGPWKPFFLGDPKVSVLTPGALFNAMVAPLAPYAIRGAIWYQGESNTDRSYQYRTLMPTLIQSWRDTWGQGDFPFFMVQLANVGPIEDEPGESDWAELREAQMMTVDALLHVGLVCATDLGAAKDVHPKDKHNVGRRLARLALADVYGYGDRVTRCGPTFDSVRFVDGRAVVQFDTYGSELSLRYGEPLTGFAIAGSDRTWVWADCRITGKLTVEVWSEAVPEPVAVRYNWAKNPQGNLYNVLLLPAYPFRTDDWPGVTVDKKTPVVNAIKKF